MDNNSVSYQTHFHRENMLKKGTLFVRHVRIKIDHKKGYGIHLVFSSLETHIKLRDTFERILGTTWRTFGLLIFVSLIQRKGIPQRGSSEKFQSITHTSIVLFYRHNKQRR